jgi:hypothetical protein
VMRAMQELTFPHQELPQTDRFIELVAATNRTGSRQIFSEKSSCTQPHEDDISAHAAAQTEGASLLS